MFNAFIVPFSLTYLYCWYWDTYGIVFAVRVRFEANFSLSPLSNVSGVINVDASDEILYAMQNGILNLWHAKLI